LSDFGQQSYAKQSLTLLIVCDLLLTIYNLFYFFSYFLTT